MTCGRVDGVDHLVVVVVASTDHFDVVDRQRPRTGLFRTGLKYVACGRQKADAAADQAKDQERGSMQDSEQTQRAAR